MGWLWLAVLAGGAFVIWRARRSAVRGRELAQPFPEHWHDLLLRRLPHYRALPPALRERLHARIRYFLVDKQFYGCSGLEITEEMRVLIAWLTCLLVLR